MVVHSAVPKVAEQSPYRRPRSTTTRLRRPRPQGHHQQATQNPLPTNPSKGIVEQEARNTRKRQDNPRAPIRPETRDAPNRPPHRSPAWPTTNGCPAKPTSRIPPPNPKTQSPTRKGERRKKPKTRKTKNPVTHHTPKEREERPTRQRSQRGLDQRRKTNP